MRYFVHTFSFLLRWLVLFVLVFPVVEFEQLQSLQEFKEYVRGHGIRSDEEALELLELAEVDETSGGQIAIVCIIENVPSLSSLSS